LKEKCGVYSTKQKYFCKNGLVQRGEAEGGSGEPVVT
jgi:hypothetical protein